MSNISEVGASKVKVESYQCSIKAISVSTEWEAPNSIVPEKVTATVFDGKTPPPGKTVYLISSPKGTDVTITTKRDEGQCKRDGHKSRAMLWNDFIKEDTQNPNSATLLDPFVFKLEPHNKLEALKEEESLKIKCFEVEGVYQALQYLPLPVPIDKSYITTFKYFSCKEGPIQYRIISYPDISFSAEFAIGTDAKPNRNKTSKFEKNTGNKKRVSTQLNTLKNEALGVKLEFSPSLTLSTSYNAGEDEMELMFNFDSEEDFCEFNYQHNSTTVTFNSTALSFTGTVKKIKDLCSLISKIIRVDFLKELMNFDAKELVENYKPYKLKLDSPNVQLSIDGRYHTSRDLTRIGKLIDLTFACAPFISIKFTVDLLFLILSGVSGGTATGFYVMLKNLDKVIGIILGDNYRKKYKNSKPFEADVFFNFIVTGAINGNVHWFIDTTEARDENSSASSIEGVLKVDLEAGAKLSLDAFFVAMEGEASASGSTGIMIRIGMENHILQGRGISFLVEVVFLGLKIKYCVKAKVGLVKTKTYGGSLADNTATLLDKTKLLSGQWTILEDKA